MAPPKKFGMTRRICQALTTAAATFGTMSAAPSHFPFRPGHEDDERHDYDNGKAEEVATCSEAMLGVAEDPVQMYGQGTNRRPVRAAAAVPAVTKKSRQAPGS